MKRRITFLLAALLLTCGLSWAQQITWSAADQGYENGEVIESVDFDDYVSAGFFQGTNSNAPKYYNTGAAIRCYGGNYFTVSSDYLLTEITFGFASGEGTNAITANVGTFENGTWTGSANEVTFTIGGTTGHRRFATFTITYTESGTPDPSITASNVEIDYDATSGTIEYTVNNPVEGGVMTATTEAEWLTFGDEGTDFTCEVNEGAARSANVTLIYTYDTDQTATKNVTVTQGSNPNVPGTENNPYTVAQAIDAIIAGEGTQNVYATGIVSAIVTDYNSQYGNITFDIVDETGDEAFVRAYRCGGSEAADVTVGDVAVIYGNLTYYNNSVYEFTQGCELVSLTHPVVTTPTVIVTPLTVNAPAEGGDGTLTVTYENITEVLAEVYFCDAEGEATTYDWITAEINNENNVYYVIDANNGEARTAYFKVWAYDDEFNEVYSDLITVNQAEYVAPALDYATLPFEFNGGKADIEGTDGLTQEGLGSDYATNNTKLKFDNAGDWLLLHFIEEPGTLTFDIKGNGFSGGTFTVQTSEDGVTYTDLAAYTELGNTTDTKTFNNLGEDVRYIKWIYTNKSSGNVGLGNIALAEYTEPAHAIVIDPDFFEIGFDGGENGFEYTVNWSEGGMAEGFEFYDAPDGETIDQPEWITIVEQTGENEDYHFTVLANEGEARSAYFKAYTDDEGTTLYSNLVTINQAAAPQPSITFDPDVIDLDAEQHVLQIPFTYENIVVTNYQSFTVHYYDAEGQEIQLVQGETWYYLGVTETNDEGYQAAGVAIANEGEARSAYFRVSALDAAGNTVYSNLVTINQAAYVAPFTGATYTLANSVESGKTYIITSEVFDDVVYAMGGQNNNNRAAVSTGIEGTTVTVETEAVYDFVITFLNETNEDGEDLYSIFDARENGYLYAASSSSNYLRTQEELTDNGKWTIVFGENGATIKAQGNNTRNWMRYNDNNNLFSCYASGQQNIYLYVKEETAPVTETYTLDITGYEAGSDGGYYLIASPVNVDPANVEGMTEGTFDLYYFDEGAEQEWRNYEATPFNLVPGKGYLYAKQATEPDEVFHFELTGTPYNGDGMIELNYTEGADFPGWNLVGNPFGVEAEISSDFYVMNEDGDEIITGESEFVQPMQGVFVVAENADDYVVFDPAVAVAPDYDKIVMNVRRDRGNIIDRAIIRFGEGRQLPKFQLNDNSTKLYIAEGEEEFAVVRSINENTTPVSFRAAENGTYTLSVNAENVEMEYLHLIDNMTGTDVDLLATPSYTFAARTTDNANRFNLVYATYDDVNENTTKPFAYFNGSEWVLNNEGEATLQVIDVNGRMLSNVTVNGNANVSLNQTSGIYMLRLVNGNSVKTQKVVVR